MQSMSLPQHRLILIDIEYGVTYVATLMCEKVQEDEKIK
jgi:hypothetical protein